MRPSSFGIRTKIQYIIFKYCLEGARRMRFAAPGKR
jgi:hypothetical protein